MTVVRGLFWLASFPKSGNTWFRLFLGNLQRQASAPADINELRGDNASNRSWLDDALGFPTADLDHDEVEQLRPQVHAWYAQQDLPRIHKIHDACAVLPGGDLLVGRAATAGALYLLRNPLDLAPSWAHHLKIPVDRIIDRMNDPDSGFSKSECKLRWQVRQRLGTWSAHVRSWVDAPGLNCHVVRYEDMLAQPFESFSAAVRFLCLPHSSADIERAIGASRFNEVAAQERQHGFKERPARAERFFRHGRSGGWREELTQSQVAKIIRDHGEVMRRFGYLDEHGDPV